MKYAKALKCLYCLGKCSKYLYYAKKAVCYAGIAIAAVGVICLLPKSKCLCKKLKEML